MIHLKLMDLLKYESKDIILKLKEYLQKPSKN